MRTALLLLLGACQSAPEAPAIAIEPSAPLTGDDLVAVPAPGPSEVWSWRWSRDGEPQEELTSARVPAGATSKGEVWTVEVVRHEGRRESEVARAEITVGNTPPEVSVRLSPDPPVPGSPLEAVVEASDPDDEELDVEIRWLRDGELAGEGPVLAGELVESLRGYAAEVSVSDGDVHATATTSASTGNEPPVVLDARIAPATATETAILLVVASVEDADGDSHDTRVEWFVDGTFRGVGPTLDGTVFDRDETVIARVVPMDRHEPGLPFDTPPVTIDNTPPVAVAAIVSPAAIVEGTVATCTLAGGADADGDPVSAELTWLVDGVAVKGGPILDGGSFDRGQTVVCEAVPTDGTDRGLPVASPAVVVGNTPPEVLSVAPVPAVPRSSDVVVAGIDVQDVDRDGVTVQVDWFADGAWIHQGPDLPPGSVRRGQHLALLVTPSDDADTGAARQSVPVQVANGLPALAGAEVSPAPLRTGDVASCVPIGASDPDGDPVGAAVTWWVDGIAVATAPHLDGAVAFDKGQHVQCALTPHDGLDAGQPVVSAALAVSDTPPAAPVADLFPPDPHADEALRCDRVADAIDPDGDPITYLVSWRVDGLPVPDTTDTIPAGTVGFGETWACTVHAVTAGASVPSVPVARTTPEAPGGNVLLVLLDDVGVDKFPSYGAHPEQPQLPVIDSLAARGVRFTRAWAHPICSPTRAAILTGRHARRTGVGATVDTETNRFDLPQAEVLLPEALRLSPWTYTTALLGKWHLDYDATPAWPDRVFAQGFDHFAGTRANLNNDPVVHADSGPFGYEWYEEFDGTDVVMGTSYATSETIDRAATLLPTLPEPWFLFLSLHAPHRPLGAAPDDLVNTETVTLQSPEWKRYNAALEAADTELGRLLAGIDPAVLDATTVIVMGDNGTPSQAIRPPFDPLREKMTSYEGGIQVPLIVAGPLVTQPGSTSDALVHARDLFTTIAHIGGVRVGGLTFADGAPPAWWTESEPAPPTGPVPIDGVTLLPWLADPDAPARRDVVYTERFSPNGAGPYVLKDQQAVHDGRFKVVRNIAGDWQLFELVGGAIDEGPDLMLTPPLAPEHGAAFQQLSTELSEICDSLAYEH